MPLSCRTLRVAARAALFASVMLTAATGAEAQTGSVHGAWRVECPAADAATRSCFATQSVSTDPEGRKVVLGIVVEANAAVPNARITFRMPPVANPDAGIGVKIDDNPPARLAITGCNAKTCEAQGWLAGDMLRQFRTGRLLRFAYFLDKRNQMTVPVTLDGIDAALNEMQATLHKP
jgi:invasion protein IalB